MSTLALDLENIDRYYGQTGQLAALEADAPAPDDGLLPPLLDEDESEADDEREDDD